MEATTWKLHRRVKTALQQTEPDERAAIEERLAALFAVPVSQWSATVARRLSGEQPRYPAYLDDSWRAYVEVIEGQPPEVLDLVHQVTLDWMANAASRNGA